METVFTQQFNEFNFDGNGTFDGDFISSNKPLGGRVPLLIYVVNGEQYAVTQKLSDRNEFATEFDVHEDKPFTLRFEGLLPDERIVLKYSVGEHARFIKM